MYTKRRLNSRLNKTSLWQRWGITASTQYRPITVAVPSKAWNVFALSKIVIVGPTQGIDVRLYIIYVCLVLLTALGWETEVKRSVSRMSYAPSGSNRNRRRRRRRKRLGIILRNWFLSSLRKIFQLRWILFAIEMGNVYIYSFVVNVTMFH
jgi:hypothetical protein